MSFKDTNGKYLRPVSTGQKTETEYMQAAFQMLRDGIPQKNAVVRVSDLSLKDMVRKIKATDEAETILAELRRTGWVKSYVKSETSGNQFLLAGQARWKTLLPLASPRLPFVNVLFRIAVLFPVLSKFLSWYFSPP